MGNKFPHFPDFRPLELEDREAIDLFTRQYAPYSDFNFFNLFCFHACGDCQVSILNGNLVVRMCDYITLEPFYSFLGSNRVAETIEHLLAFAREQAASPYLRLIPEFCIREALDHVDKRFVFSEDPDNADYIIDVPSMVALTSGLWRGKRKAASKFKRSHPNHVIEHIHLHDSGTQAQIRRLFSIWAEKRGKSPEGVRREIFALERAMQHAKHFNLVSLGGFVGERRESFTINEAVHDGYYIGHFGKANPVFPGLATVLESETARIMLSYGCGYMNYQQDLGLAGLRQFKHSWHPSSYLRKFTVSM